MSLDPRRSSIINRIRDKCTSTSRQPVSRSLKSTSAAWTRGGWHILNVFMCNISTQKGQADVKDHITSPRKTMIKTHYQLQVPWLFKGDWLEM